MEENKTPQNSSTPSIMDSQMAELKALGYKETDEIDIMEDINRDFGIVLLKSDKPWKELLKDACDNLPDEGIDALDNFFIWFDYAKRHKTQEQIAEEYKLTRQTINHRLKQWSAFFELVTRQVSTLDFMFKAIVHVWAPEKPVLSKENAECKV